MQPYPAPELRAKHFTDTRILLTNAVKQIKIVTWLLGTTPIFRVSAEGSTDTRVTALEHVRTEHVNMDWMRLWVSTLQLQWGLDEEARQNPCKIGLWLLLLLLLLPKATLRDFNEALVAESAFLTSPPKKNQEEKRGQRPAAGMGEGEKGGRGNRETERGRS